jgi:hypothetical protein
MMAKKKPEQKTTAHMSKYADVLTGTMVEVPEGQEPPATHSLKVEPEAPEVPEPPLRELPKGMNKFNSTNEFLMLILESLYRIERKLGA